MDRSTIPAQLREAKERVLKSLTIIAQIQDKESIMLPVGSEWKNLDFAKNVSVKEIGWIKENDETDVVSMEIAQGTLVEAHFHDNDETIICCRGEMYCPINKVRLRKSDVWKIPAGVTHQLEFLADTQLIVVWHPKFVRNESNL